jgi:hypothetical protein
VTVAKATSTSTPPASSTSSPSASAATSTWDTAMIGFAHDRGVKITNHVALLQSSPAQCESTLELTCRHEVEQSVW